MNNYVIAENKIIDRLNEKFRSEFEDMYKSLKVQGKSCILKYIPALFKRWYYSALIEDTVITPAAITEYGSESENVYPIVRVNSINRIGSFDFKNLKYSVENHPMCEDFRAVVDRFESGVALDDDLKMKFEDVKEINTTINCDGDYITYLIMLGIDMDYIEKMPSVGVEMYCTTDRAKELKNISNKELLVNLYNGALKISSSFLSDSFLDESYDITPDMLKVWLAKGDTVDKIFEEAYGNFSIDVSLAMAFEDMDEMERALTANTYMRGLLLDKWFLTPFSSYFRFIDTVYMYEFSFYDELMYLINAEKTYEILGDEEIIDAAVYAPCTIYKTSKLGAEFFNINYSDKKPIVFEKISIESILKGSVEGNLKERRRILKLYKSTFNVCNLKISLEGNENNKYRVQIKDNMPLNEFHFLIVSLFGEYVKLDESFKFYKLPASPFTEYTPSFMGLRGPHTDDYTIGAVLDDGEKCYYEQTVQKGESCETYKICIELESITSNEIGVRYPNVIKL